MPAPLPWLKWYAERWYGNAEIDALELDEQGAYFRLLNVQWIHGSIPADPARVRRLLGSPRRFPGIWRAIEQFFPIGASGGRENPFLALQQAGSAAYQEAQRHKGRKRTQPLNPPSAGALAVVPAGGQPPRASARGDVEILETSKATDTPLPPASGGGAPPAGVARGNEDQEGPMDQLDIPGSGAATTGTRRATAAALSKHRAAAGRVLAAMSAGRLEVVPGARPLAATDENLRYIAERLAAGAGEADCLHVVAVRVAEVRAGGEARWLNPVTPFRPASFARSLAMRLEDARPPAGDRRSGKGAVGDFSGTDGEM